MSASQFKVFHFHHGVSGDGFQTDYRNRAQQIVKDFCSKNKIDFYSRQAEQELKSEAEFRKARLVAVKDFILLQRDEFKSSLLVWAHHSDDLLETRLIRLMRGIGPEGLQGMAYLHGRNLRPLLGESKKNLEQYAQQMNVDFRVDPSNSQTKYLRNWLRHKWIPSLEKKRPGSARAMAESFEMILKTVTESKISTLGTLHQILTQYKATGSISWVSFLPLSDSEKAQCLAQVFSAFPDMIWTKNHINETLKQLAQGKKGHIFKITGLVVTVGEQHFSIEKAGLYPRG